MTNGLSEWRRTVLAALCDTFLPAVERDPDPDGTWALCASDLQVPAALELLLQARLPAQELAGLGLLLDGLGQAGLVDAPPAGRERVVLGAAASSPEAAAGLEGLRQGALTLAYALPGPAGPEPVLERARLPRAAAARAAGSKDHPHGRAGGR
jgi:hypothetical protein